MRNFALRSAVALSLAALPNAQAIAESIPVSALTSYENFRSDLLRSGWVPDYNYGAKHDDGSPMYLFPEVICGNKLCSAQWIGRTDRKRVVFVLWMDPNGGYRVAPQIEFSN